MHVEWKPFFLHPEVIGSLLGRCNLQWKFAVCSKDQAQVSRLHIVGCVNLSYCRVCQISHGVAFRFEALIESPLAFTDFAGSWREGLSKKLRGT